jgi:hypothetical protein
MLFYWPGNSPWLLDLDTHQTGWCLCLVLARGEERCLWPVAWQRDVPDPEDEPFLPSSFAADALDNKKLAVVLGGLVQDGWQVCGRLDVDFSGRTTRSNFWEEVQIYLWQKNEASDLTGARDGS